MKETQKKAAVDRKATGGTAGSGRKVCAPSSGTRSKKAAAVKSPVGSSHVPASGSMKAAGAAAGTDEGRVHSSKFVTVLPAIPEEDLGLLPSAYDADRIFAVPRDPERVFATWEVSAATRRRAHMSGFLLRFIFDDGQSSEEVTDNVGPGVFQYYCAVPEGMLAVRAELAIDTGHGFEVVASSERVGLAIAFVRQGQSVFATVDGARPLSGGRESIITVDSPAGLPVEDFEDELSDDGDVRANIGYMPVSGRK